MTDDAADAPIAADSLRQDEPGSPRNPSPAVADLLAPGRPHPCSAGLGRISKDVAAMTRSLEEDDNPHREEPAEVERYRKEHKR